MSVVVLIKHALSFFLSFPTFPRSHVPTFPRSYSLNLVAYVFLNYGDPSESGILAAGAEGAEGAAVAETRGSQKISLTMKSMTKSGKEGSTRMSGQSQRTSGRIPWIVALAASGR